MKNHFLWSVTVPFLVMYVTLWSPGTTDDDADENKINLLSFMCDLSQFIVSSNTTSTEDHILDHIFMPDVIMTFGMNSVVVIDDGSPFKGIFVTVCGILKLNYAYLEVIIGQLC